MQGVASASTSAPTGPSPSSRAPSRPTPSTPCAVTIAHDASWSARSKQWGSTPAWPAAAGGDARCPRGGMRQRSARRPMLPALARGAVAPSGVRESPHGRAPAALGPARAPHWPRVRSPGRCAARLRWRDWRRQRPRRWGSGSDLSCSRCRPCVVRGCGRTRFAWARHRDKVGRAQAATRRFTVERARPVVVHSRASSTSRRSRSSELDQSFTVERARPAVVHGQ